MNPPPAGESAVSPVNEGELAWKLATALTPALPTADRTTVYLKLGCGDHFDAIVHLLAATRARGLTLSNDLAAMMDRWRCGYIGSNREHTVDQLTKLPEKQRV